MDLAELRRQVAQLPSIAEISTGLKVILEITPTSTVPADIPLTSTPALSRPSDFSPSSVGLSQADSGFGSPRFPVPDIDESSDYDGDVSGVELLDDSFDDDDREAGLSISDVPDGNSRTGLTACASVQVCFVCRDLPTLPF